MAEVSRELRAGLRKLGSVKVHLAASASGCLPAAGAGAGYSRRAGLNDEGELDDSEEKRERRAKLEDRPGTDGAGVGQPPPEPSLSGLVLLHSSIVRLTGQAPPADCPSSSRSCRSCRMACWVNRGVLLTAGAPREQSAGHPHRTYSTLLLSLQRPPRHRPGLLTTQTCNWSNSRTSEGPLHRSKTAYYEILQVSPNATHAQIKTAYYKQSFLYHPDKNAGSEEATQHFAQISEAYSVLGSVGLRKKYDRGILSPADIQGAGRPSSKEALASPRSPGQQHRERRRSQAPSNMTVGGKPVFDFDAFFQAHYGEQLQREQAMRQWRKHSEEKNRQTFGKWKFAKMMEMTVGMLLAMGGFIIFSLRS